MIAFRAIAVCALFALTHAGYPHAYVSSPIVATYTAPAVVGKTITPLATSVRYENRAYLSPILAKVGSIPHAVPYHGHDHYGHPTTGYAIASTPVIAKVGSVATGYSHQAHKTVHSVGISPVIAPVVHKAVIPAVAKVPAYPAYHHHHHHAHHAAYDYGHYY